MENSKTTNILLHNNIKPAVEGRCGFLVQRKQRYCKMLPAKGNTFCAEHLNEDKEQKESLKRKRIACPLDPKHTVFEDKLPKHLKKCNATLKTQLPFYSADINCRLKDYIYNEVEKAALHLTPPEELKELINKVKLCYRSNFHGKDMTESYCLHPVLDDERAKPGYGTNIMKHLIQQASIIRILQEICMLRDNMVVIEFGAGRGALSHWVQKAMKDKKNTNFLLVDRQHNRNKLDCYHKGDEQGPNFERLNIDIQHLDLGKVASLTENDLQFTAIGKHLCGGATDLSLKCILDADCKVQDSNQPIKKRKGSSITSRLHSCLFALCCYHRCTWSTYVGAEFFTQHSFTPLDFHRITKMAGWASCGFEKRHLDHQNERTADTDSLSHNEEQNDNESQQCSGDHNEYQQQDKVHRTLGLTSHEQEDIGRMCKRLIDLGRIDYIRRHGYDANLVTYVKQEITPENVALVIKEASRS